METKLKRFLIYTGTFLICFLLQTSVFEFFQLAHIRPNILLIFVVSFAFMRGQKVGLVLGFITGLCLDILYGRIIGPYCLLFMYMGYISGYYNRLFYKEEILLPLILTAINDLVYGLVIYFVFFLLQNKLNFLSYFVSTMLPEMIYTILVSLILYRIFLFINSHLDRDAKGVSSNVI